MFTKAKQIGLICIAVASITLFLLAGMSLFTSTVADSYNATAGGASAGNYTFYLGFLKSMPLWIIAIPAFVGGVMVWVTLKRSRKEV